MPNEPGRKNRKPPGRGRLKQFLGRIPCLIGLHHRSKKRAGKQPNAAARFTSVCTFCEVPMEQRPDGKWVVSTLNVRGG